MPPFETIQIDTMVAACDGGDGAMGHPRVFLNLSVTGEVECPYCSRLFVNKARRGGGAETDAARAVGPLSGDQPPSATPAEP
jgi:uncharacterized Zn-finger protein